MAQIEKAQNDRDLAITKANQTATFEAQRKSGLDIEAARQQTLTMESAFKNKNVLIAAAADTKKKLQEILVSPVKEGTAAPDMGVIQQMINECNQEISALMQPEQPQGQQQDPNAQQQQEQPQQQAA